MLTKDQLELISKIPESEMNPYRKASMGYYYEDGDEDKMDPKLREALQIDDKFMP